MESENECIRSLKWLIVMDICFISRLCLHTLEPKYKYLASQSFKELSKSFQAGDLH